MLIALGAGWALVLVLWSSGLIRQKFSVLFLLALVAALVQVADGAWRMATRGDGVQTSLRAACLSLFLLVPVAFDPTTLDVFNVTKYALVVAAGLVLAALWVVHRVARGAFPSWRNGLHWPVLALLGWTVVCTAASDNVRISVLGAYSSYDGLLAAMAFTMVFFAVAQAFRPQDLRTVASVFFFGGAGLVALYGMIQLHDRTWGGVWDWVNWGAATFKTEFIWSALGNPNHLAGFLATALPVGLVLLIVLKNLWARLLLVAICAGILLEILQTGARGAWIAVAASLALLAVLLRRELVARRGLAVAAVLGLSVVILGAGPVLGSSFDAKKQLESMFETGPKSTAFQRMELWKSGLEMVQDRPVLGVGPDNYRAFFPRYQSARFVQEFGPEQLANGPHNIFMRYLVELGIPGLLALLAVLGFAALRANASLRRLLQIERTGSGAEVAEAREVRILLAGLAAAIVANVVQGSFNVQQIGLSFCLWALLGVVCAVATGVGVPPTLQPAILRELPDPGEAGFAPVASSAAAVPGRRRGASSRRGRTAKRAASSPKAPIAVVVAGILVAVLGWRASAPYRADAKYRLALIYQPGAIDPTQPLDQTTQFQLFRSTQELKGAIRTNPWEASYRAKEAAALSDQARQLLGAGQTDAARSALESARGKWAELLELQPRNARFLIDSAGVLLRLQEVTKDEGARLEAIALLRRAVDANPWLDAYWATLATALAQSGRLDESLAAVLEGLEVHPTSPELLRDAAKLYSAKEDPEEALRYWRLVDKYRPGDLEAVAVLRANGLTPTLSS